MTDRELSEKLDNLACKIEDIVRGDISNEYPYMSKLLKDVAGDLRDLSNEKFTPGHTTWENLKQRVTPSPKDKRYRDSKGRTTPF